MTTENGDASEVEAKLGDKSVRLKTKHMAELISILLLLASGVGLYMFWQHVQQTETGIQAMVAIHKESFKEITETNKQLIAAQREMNCLIALPQDRRELEYMSPYSFCRTVTR